MTKLSISVDDLVHEGLQIEAVRTRTDVPSVIQRVLSDHVTGAGYLEQSKSAKLSAFWSLVDDAVAKAEMICDREGASADITAKACDACANDPNWRARYEAYIEGPAFGKGNPKKGKINREIGFQIRAALEAEVKLKEDKKPDSAVVLVGIIQTYTVFAKVRGKPVT